jgi:outer membrane protein OmpA-like peptidoglycan-associated protein
VKSKKAYLFALGGLPLLCAACGAAAPSKELLTARDAYAKAGTSNVAQVNPAGARQAQEALQAAEAAHHEDAGSERERTAAYVATRKSELAVAQADEARARQERENAEQAYQAQLEQHVLSAQQELETLQAAAEKATNEKVGWRKRGQDLVITLSGVSFDSGGHNLTPDAKKRLDVVAHALKEYPERIVTISGYTDNAGKKEANLMLSQKRADSVRAYLESQGVAPSRLISEGRGEDNPIASNDTAEGKASNRRVDITLHPAGGRVSERQPVKGTDAAPVAQGKQK